MIARGPLRIGDVADRTGLAVSAIRHYEAEGLVHAVRDQSGQRRFGRADIRRLSFVMIAQQLGFSLAEIKMQLDALPKHRAPTKTDWGRVSAKFRQRIDARITRLEALRDKLDGCIGCGCLSLETCQLYNPEDRAARAGKGPRYLMGDRP
ncbi:MAG: redox-sensitive transcriptional activator SoxR [Pseudomonadota bacterium]